MFGRKTAIEDLEYRIAQLTMRPGDLLVVKLNKIVPPEISEMIGQHCKATLPPGIHFIVLDPTVDLEVLSRDDIEERVITAEVPMRLRPAPKPKKRR